MKKTEKRQYMKEAGTGREKACFEVKIGDGQSRNCICELGDGVFLWANEIHDRSLDFPGRGPDPESLMVINLCLRGRCEISLPEENYVYMMPGLVNVSSYKPADGYYYPGSLYEGVEIALDRKKISRKEPAWSAPFGLTSVYLTGLLDRGKLSLMAAVGEEAMKAGNELYRALLAQDLKKEDYRFMTVKLLYLLKNGEATAVRNMHYATKGQRRIANEAERKITEDFRKHYTVEELAKEYGISPSALKKYFEIVYGMPISRYLRGKRMENARYLLAETEMSVGDIAAACGYENQGKFGTAFKADTGVLPLEYRRQYFGTSADEKAEDRAEAT